MTDIRTDIKYEQSGLDQKILRAVSEMGYETMTPIQAQAVPVLLTGQDVIGQAQTGTGKTAAFGIPLLQKIDPEDRNVQAIVLCPTRELAIQAAEEMRKYAKFMHGIKILPVYGGQDMKGQIRALKGGIQVIVGTPGRVMDHMRRHTLKLDNVRTVVLDEADEMLNMGFREDMETILKEVPQEHQTALFSATMPQAILDITSQFQKDPVFVKIPTKELTVSLVKQYYVVCKKEYKAEVIRRLKETYGLSRSLIFCNTKKMVDDLADILRKMGYQAEGLHGDLNQKQRDAVMGRFRAGTLEFLIATDVAARGIDVDELEAVFNYDIPLDTEYYVHRIGRTGRAGREGMSFTLINGREMWKIREIERVCKTSVEQLPLPASSELIRNKAEESLEEARKTMENQDLTQLKAFLREKLADEGLDAVDIAAAFLKMQIGNCESDVPDEMILDTVRESGKKKSEGNRSERRSRGRRSGSDPGREELPFCARRPREARYPNQNAGRMKKQTRVRTRNMDSIYGAGNNRKTQSKPSGATMDKGRKRQNRAG